MYLPIISAEQPLYNGSFDHMDSSHTSEGPYAFDGNLGYPWTASSAKPGLMGLVRIYNAQVEHATIVDDDFIAGYNTRENFGLYGYRRFDNAAEVLNALSGGGVTIKSNSVAGGSLWSWVWNGIEFVDHQDYGREMQADVLWIPDGHTVYNPTEAGAQYSFPTVTPAARQGAPVLNNQNSGLMQITRAIPLQFDPTPFGGDNTHPVIYPQMQIGKDITLNYNNMGPVAHYVTQVSSDVAIPAASIEIPTGYMPSSTFSRFYEYDAQTQTLVEIHPQQNSCTGSDNSAEVVLAAANSGINSPGGIGNFSGHGGVIISNADQSAAMGIYGGLTTVGGSVSYFALFNLTACGSTVKWSAARMIDLPAGGSSFNTWVASGTLSGVVANMHALYAGGAN